MSNARHHHPRSLRRTWAGATALVMVLLPVTLLGTGVAQALVKALLPMGTQTVVLKIQLRSGGKASFSGTFAGKPLEGKFREDRPIDREEAVPEQQDCRRFGGGNNLHLRREVQRHHLHVQWLRRCAWHRKRRASVLPNERESWLDFHKRQHFLSVPTPSTSRK